MAAVLLAGLAAAQDNNPAPQPGAPDAGQAQPAAPQPEAAPQAAPQGEPAQQQSAGPQSGPGFPPISAPNVPKAAPATAAEPMGSAAASVSGSTASAPSPAAQAPAGGTRAIRLKVHKDAADWDPVSLRVAGDVESLSNDFEFRITRRTVKGKKVSSGRRSRAKASAHLRPFKDDHKLIVALFPEKLKRLHKHLEVRFLVSEGFLEKASVVAVTLEAADAARAPKDADSWQLERAGVSYQEDYASAGDIKLAAVDAKPGRGALNAGRATGLEFADSDLGAATLAWSVKGLAR